MRALALCALVCATAQAQDITKSASGKIAEVRSADRRILIGKHWYRITSDTRITLDTAKASLAALKADQEVTVLYRETGRTTRLAETVRATTSLDVPRPSLLAMPALPQLDPASMKLDDKGTFPPQSRQCAIKVVQVVDKEKATMVAICILPQEVVELRTFRVKGYPTKGMADNELVELKGVFKVTGNDTYISLENTKRTVILLEPETADEKAKREAEEKKLAVDIEKKNKVILEAWEQEVKDRKAAAEKRRQNTEKRTGPENDQEKRLAARLKLIQQLVDEGKNDAAKFRLQKLIEEFPDSKAAKKAKEMLDGLP